MTKGISLLELIIYMAIFVVIAGLFIGILTTTTRVQFAEVATNEVSNQLNFTLQTMQRLVRESSNIEVAAQSDNPETPTTELAYLKLRMQSALSDPTCISLVETEVGKGTIRLVQGPAGPYPLDKNCKDSSTNDNIITDKVFVPTSPLGLTLNHLTNYPAHDSVNISLTLNYLSSNPQSQIARNLKTAIGRVSAATFDSNLLPGSAGSYDIGQDSTRWRNLFVNDLNVGGNFSVNSSGNLSQGENYDGGGRGYFVVNPASTQNCTNTCSTHGLTCNAGWDLFSGVSIACSNNAGVNRLCFCQ